MKFWSLPTWLVSQCVRPFLPRSHPWRAKFYTLQHWYDTETPLRREFEFGFWSCLLALVLLVELFFTQL